MSVPKVSNCCFFYTLYFGSLLIGYLSVLISVTELFIYTAVVTLVPLSIHKLIFFSVSAGVSFCQLLGAVLLIIGTVKKRASLTLPWTIISGMMVAIHLMLGVTGAALYVQYIQELDMEKICVVVIYFFKACITIYFIMVVHSRHKEIMFEKQCDRAHRNMSVPKVSNCCFFYTLYFGSLLIGYLSVLISVTELFIYTAVVTLVPLSIHKLIFFSVSAGVSFCQLLGAVLLIIGTVKKRASLTLPWTIISGMMVAIHLMLGVTGAALYVQYIQELDMEKICVVVIYFFKACITIYFIMVVHSRHKEIMFEKQCDRAHRSVALYSQVSTNYS